MKLLLTLLSVILFSVSLGADVVPQDLDESIPPPDSGAFVERTLRQLDAPVDLFADSFEGLSEGSVCTQDADCANGLLCCYPCGIPGCENQCTVPVDNMCLLVP